MLDLIPGRQPNALQQQHPFSLRQMNGMNGSAILQGQQQNANNRMQMANDMNRMRLQQALAARNPNMQALQNMQTPANINRQLELMGIAHQQNQHQPGAASSMAALRQLQHHQQQQHQQQQQQPGQQMLGMANRMGQLPNQMQGNFMSNPGMQQVQEQAASRALDMMNQQQRRMQMMSQLGGMQQVQGNPANRAAGMSPAQLRERGTILQQSVAELEKQAKLLQARNQGRQDAEYFAEAQKLHNEITQKKSVMLKIAQTLHNINTTGGMGALVGNVYVLIFSRMGRTFH